MLSREKNKVSYLHFILSVLVILIHSINNETKLEEFFSIDKGIGQFAVPLFFFISGFLFFRTIKNKYDVKNKIIKRVYSLLIPYVLWNLIYYALHLLKNPGLGLNLSLMTEAAFEHTFNPTFWFIYQLILLTIISPLLFILLKNNKRIVLCYIILAILIINEANNIFVNTDAIVYYFSGAVFSRLYNDGKVSFISKRNIVFSFIILCTAFAINRLALYLVSINFNFRTLFILTIVIVRLTTSIFIFYLFDLFFTYDKVYHFMENTFFLYAIHYLIVRIMITTLNKLEYMFLAKYLSSTVIELIEIIIFIISPIICVYINYYLTRYIKKKNIKVYNYLSGNRSK